MAQTNVVAKEGGQLPNEEQERQLEILLHDYAIPAAITDAPTDPPARPPVPDRSRLRLPKKTIPVDVSSSEDETLVQCIAAPTNSPPAPGPAPGSVPVPLIRPPRVIQLGVYPNDQHDAPTSSSDEEIVIICQLCHATMIKSPRSDDSIISVNNFI